jgi:hypothetical protein
MEFLVVYSFVLLIFSIMFLLITSQRAASLAQQQYAMLELQVQNIAIVINEAADAGSGFSVTVPLQSALSSSAPYNLSVSSTGVVVAQEKIGEQVLSAYAFSSARALSINGTLLPNGNGYLIPTSRGTLHVANSHGTVYVDSTPATVVPLTQTLTLTQLQHVKAVSFNGVNSNIVVASSTSLDITNAITVAAWVELPAAQFSATSQPYILSDQMSGNKGYGLQFQYDVYSQEVQTVVGNSVNWANSPFSSPLSLNTWYYVVGTAQNNGNIALYINGALNTQSAFYGNIGGSTGSLHISGNNFNGIVSNIQIYNSLLTANQIMQLYLNGIGGVPVSSSNVVAWWPLNGNANDYSGNGNTGTPANAVFNSVVCALIHASLSSGASAVNALVGGITGSGVFTSITGNGVTTTNSFANFATYSNSTGYVKAYINAPNVSRLNFTLFGFNGNSTTVGNLVGWWPLEEGYGNTVYDLSARNNNGIFNGPAWAPLANQTNIAVASFNGVSSYVNLGANIVIPNTARGLTFGAWIMLSQGGVQQDVISRAAATSDLLEIQTTNAVRLNVHLSTTDANINTGSFTLSTGRWYYIAGTYNVSAGNAYIFVNGVQEASGSGSGNLVDTGDTVYAGSLGGTSRFFNGIISNVQIYSTPLSASQVASLYSEGIAGTPIANAGISGWWPSAYSTNDYSGNGNFGTPTNVVYINAALSAPANTLSAASFNGVGSYVGVPSSGVAFNGKSAISITAWVYPSTFPADPDFSTIATKYAAYYLQLTPAGQPAAYLQGVNSGYFYSPSAVAGNTWSQVGFTYNGAVEVLYINGQATNTIAASGAITDTGNNYLGIGANLNTAGGLYAGYNRRFNGLIADVQVYNAPLTAQQMQQLYLQGLPLYDKLNVTFG